jgi:hypothetical protein
MANSISPHSTEEIPDEGGLGRFKKVPEKAQKLLGLPPTVEEEDDNENFEE